MDEYLQQSTTASLSYTHDVYGSSSMMQRTLAEHTDQYGSSGMQRTLSDHTDHSNRSTDSNHSIYSAGAGEYHFQTSPVSARGEQPSFDYTVPSYAAPYGNGQDTEYLFGSMGSQYQDVDESTSGYLPLTSSFQLLESRESDDAAALQATQLAQEQLVSDAYREPGFTIVTYEAVDSALKHLRKRYPNSSDREAIQDVLRRYLSRHLNDANPNQAKVSTALQEAACQLQLRVQGEEAYNICYFAIAAVLARLREQLPEENFETQDQGGSSSMRQSTSSASQRFMCLVQGCKQKGFGRAADLERHHKMVHLADEEKKKFLCDYKRCPRHELPFYRQDHFRDHLRDFHKEDLLRRGNKADDKWWKSRATYAIFNNWWRCNRCLVTRVNIKTDGYVCPKCSMHCETERQRYRMSAR